MLFPIYTTAEIVLQSAAKYQREVNDKVRSQQITSFAIFKIEMG